MIYAVVFVAVILIVFLVVAARQPDTFRVERFTTIAAAPASVFAQVDDFHNWQHWSPYVELDPNMQTTYSGAPSGRGASMAWSGNNKAGTGTMTILEDRPGELVRMKLQFTKPFAATNTAEFTFRPEGTQTHVTWAMLGKNSFMFKVMSTAMNMDKMVGRDFERGLAKLKTLTETQS